MAKSYKDVIEENLAKARTALEEVQIAFDAHNRQVAEMLVGEGSVSTRQPRKATTEKKPRAPRSVKSENATPIRQPRVAKASKAPRTRKTTSTTSSVAAEALS